MRKLKLRFEDLAVESFATAKGPHLRGTAHAHGDPGIAGDAAYAGTLPDDTSIAPGGETEPDLCYTCELSCGTRGC